jgi:hypothetical protein
MEDAQSPPPDAENQKGDKPRRTGLRLRDAEAVASIRRDIFGDGSLLDALAGRSPPPEQEQSRAAEVSMQTEPVETSPANFSEPEPTTTLKPDVAAPEPQQASSPEAAQTLDAIIDSFPAEPPSQDAVQEPPADPGLRAVSPPFASQSQGADGADPASDRSPPADPERFEVSAIFEGLGQAEQPHGGPEGGSETPGAGAPLPEAFGTHGVLTDGPGGASLDGQGGDGAQAGAPPGSPFPAPPAWPPFPELPGAEAERSAPEPSGLPPYIELPATPETAPGYSESRQMPDFSAAPLPAGTHPFPPSTFPDAPAFAPPFAGSQGLPPFQPPPAAAPSFADPLAASALPEPSEVASSPDIEAARPAPDAAGSGSAEVTAKIAAEANATAQALDNLQRLLSKTAPSAAPAPQPQPVRPQPRPQRPQRPRDVHRNRQANPAPFPHRERADRLSPPVPGEWAGGKSIYLLGFLTGLALSLMAGAALYFLINTG